MPHVIVKLWPGKSEQQKQRLAEAIAKDVIGILGSKDESVSVSLEEIDQERWRDEVYIPDIVNQPDRLYRKPGYEL